MTQRQQEIFAQLSTGLDFPKSVIKKRQLLTSQSDCCIPSTAKKTRTNRSKGAGSEEVGLLRKRYGIKISSSSTAPPPFESFQEVERIGLKRFGDFMEAKGFKNFTPIQMQTIPALWERRDVVGIAPTGSGKTFAFLVPLLSLFLPSCGKDESSIGAVVLSPTHELSHQTFHVFLDLRQHLIRDCIVEAALLDKSIRRKKKERLKEVDVLFATPYALVKCIKKGRMNFANVQFLILDEADRLLSMERGSESISDQRHYVSQLDCILSSFHANKSLTKGMFSATFPPQVADLANNILLDPLYITVGKKNVVIGNVQQSLVYTGGEQGKLLALRQVFAKELRPPVIIFVDTKERVTSLMDELRYDGLHLAPLHSDLPTAKRNRVLREFEEGSVWVLIATDLMSRGIDFHGVKMVINYDFPKSSMDYIHRIGRTGRGGNNGKSVTFFTDLDKGYIRPIANIIKESGHHDIPSWMTSLRKENWKEKRKYGQVGIDPYHETS